MKPKEQQDLQYFPYYSFIFQITDKPITCCFNNQNNQELRMRAHSSALFFCTEHREAKWRAAYLTLTGLTSLTPIGLTFHISSAYCLMVLSLENLPEDATFKIAMVNQWSWSWKKTSLSFFKEAFYYTLCCLQGRRRRAERTVFTSIIYHNIELTSHFTDFKFSQI